MWVDRQKTNPGSIVTRQTIFGSDSFYVPPVSYDDSPSDVLIFYEAKDDSGGPRSGWNAFQHYKMSRELYAGDISYELSRDHNGSGPFAVYAHSARRTVGLTTSWLTSSGGSYPWGSTATPFADLRPLYVDSLVEGRKVLTPANIQTLVEDSLSTMLPGIRPRLSAVNSIYELKDFKSLPHTIAKAGSLTKELKTLSSRILRSGLKSPVPSILSLPYRKILKVVSDVYLQKEFNVMPLLSDLLAIRQVALSVRNQVENLIKNEGKTRIRHYTKDLQDPYVDRQDTFSIPKAAMFSADGDHTCLRNVTYSLARFHAEMEYSYKLRDFELDNSLPRGALDALGVNLNPVIIWNAIPWSFVVDWFIGVNQWLSQFALRNLEPQTHISRYLWSFHCKRVGTVSCNGNGTGNLYHGESPIPICTMFEEAYCRFPWTPDIYRSLRANSLNLKEFSLGAALALTR